MEKEEFKYIWKTKVAANSPWYPAASSEDTAKLYRDRLIKLDKTVLSKAVDKLLVDETGSLPSVGKFLEYCRWVRGEGPNPKPLKICPCCRGSRWIFLEEVNGVVPCDCSIQPKEQKISYRFGPNKKCESGECSPRGTVFVYEKPIELPECPRGDEYYQKMTAPKQSDLSGVGAEDLTFKL